MRYHKVAPVFTASSNLTNVFLSDAARGMAQQMVWWGHDVRHPDGNALLRFGMERKPSPGLTGTSCYSAAWQGGRIELHGAVASWTPGTDAAGCVFSRNCGRIAIWKGREAPIPGREDGEVGSADERWQAARPLMEWLVAYEEWVIEALGASWRSGCWAAVKQLPKGKRWLPPAEALRWWKLAVTSTPPRPRKLMQSAK